MAGKKMDFSILEQSTAVQNRIANWLLLVTAMEVINETRRKSLRVKRRGKFDELKSAIMPDYDNDRELIDVIKEWWDEELGWYGTQKKTFKEGPLINALAYRIQRVFFKNHIAVPFTKKVKGKEVPDVEDFHKMNQTMFLAFLECSRIVISKTDRYDEIKAIDPLLEALCYVDIPKIMEGTVYDLNDEGWKKFKNFLVGGITLGVGGLILGPAIGAFIGGIAGLSGAAATSYGLALLGGGSLASGGLGMAGGSMVLGLGFGIAGGIKDMVGGAASKEELERLQAVTLLPSLLSVGWVHYNVIKKRHIPKLIHGTVAKRLKDLEKRRDTLEGSDKKEDKQRLENIEASIALYENASSMSESYDWFSVDDLNDGEEE